MSAAEALKAARAVGIHLEVDGDDLLLEASCCDPVATAGRRRTGRSSLMNAPASSSSMADCLVRRQRPKPSTAASSNG